MVIETVAVVLSGSAKPHVSNCGLREALGSVLFADQADTRTLLVIVLALGTDVMHDTNMLVSRRLPLSTIC